MSDLPVVEPPADPSDPSSQRVAGVLLAAGTSSRFGEANKLLAAVDGTPIVRRSARALLDVGLDPVVVVVGYQAGRVREALDGLAVTFVENPDYADGQATSVRAGVMALPADVDATVIALGDMPWVSPETIEALVGTYTADRGTALAAAYLGERGNPVLWDRRHFDALAGVVGDVGGRALLQSIDDAALVETGDPGVRRDVDRDADLP